MSDKERYLEQCRNLKEKIEDILHNENIKIIVPVLIEILCSSIGQSLGAEKCIIFRDKLLQLIKQL